MPVKSGYKSSFNDTGETVYTLFRQKEVLATPMSNLRDTALNSNCVYEYIPSTTLDLKLLSNIDRE